MSLKSSSLVGAVVFLAACQPAEPLSSQVVPKAEQLLWNDSHGRPQLLSGRFESSGATAELSARSFLTAHAAAFHLDDPALSLELASVKRSLGGDYLRFEQRHGRWPVFGADVVVLVDAKDPRTILAVNLGQREEVASVVAGRDIGGARAEELALASVAAKAPFRVEPELELGVFVPERKKATKGLSVPAQGPALAWRVRVSTDLPAHDWEVFVEAASGAVLSRRDRLAYVNGTGMIFDANPVETTGIAALLDSNDATSSILDGARYSVTLSRLDSSGYLRGPYVDSRPANAGARVISATNTYNFDRSQSPSFEQVNVYYHLDRVQDRVQTVLGINNANNRMQVAIVNAQTADNSFYSPAQGTLNFGTGGVDDAEDGEIVMHEYGHAMQDNQVSNFGGGDEGAMGEGFGDYLAGSMGQTLRALAGHAQQSDPACIGDWDATAYATTQPPCLRRVDGTKHYPEFEAGEVHDDGEMWSAGLWGIHDQLGADVTDKVVIEAHFLLGRSATFFTAGQALVTTDTTISAGAHAAQIRRRLIQQGLLRTLTTVDAGSVVVSVPASIDNPRDSTGKYVNKLDDTQTFTVPGASAIAVHFATVDTENDNTCLANTCDNIYLTGANGDLFQVLGGASQTNITSSAIEGDTVKIRLVTDVSTVRTGYHVDRIDVLGVVDGGVIDGGLIIDGGAADAGSDGGRPDSGVDAGVTDSGVPDSGAPDSGSTDSGVDSGVPDSGVDSGTPEDAGSDAGVQDKVLPLGRDVVLGNELPKSGCGCSAASGLEVWAGLLGLTALAKRRRSPPKSRS